MLFVVDAAALATRVVRTAPLSGVGAVDVPVRDGAQPVKRRPMARREMGFMRRRG